MASNSEHDAHRALTDTARLRKLDAIRCDIKQLKRETALEREARERADVETYLWPVYEP